MLSSDGCQADKQACKAAAALMAFECSWCAVEGLMIFLILWRYKENKFDCGRGEDNGDGRAGWVRGYQVRRAYSLTRELIRPPLTCPCQAFLSAASAVVLILSFIPGCIAVPDGIRTGVGGGLLIVGACTCVFFCIWHLLHLLCPCFTEVMEGSYGRYVTFVVVEYLALVAPFSIFLVSLPYPHPK